MLIIMPSNEAWMYSIIKRVFDVSLGVLCQCVIASKFSKLRGGPYDLQYFANVAMKFNKKLGGTNHWLAEKGRDGVPRYGGKGLYIAKETMIVGADVTPPDANSAPGTPSLSAVVATIDERLDHYLGSMRLQNSKQEVRKYTS